MKSLLIIGASGHGNVVAEVAEACGYTHIEFIDDNSTKAIGKICDLEKFRDQFDEAFVGIANNLFRDKMIDRLLDLGYKVPVLIHPSAYVNKTAKILEGTIIEPKVIVNLQSIIERGCIISIGTIIDHNVEIGKACHINSGAIVNAGSSINEAVKLESGEIVMRL